jgi:hypothetical protein
MEPYNIHEQEQLGLQQIQPSRGSYDPLVEELRRLELRLAAVELQMPQAIAAASSGAYVKNAILREMAPEITARGKRLEAIMEDPTNSEKMIIKDLETGIPPQEETAYVH